MNIELTEQQALAMQAHLQWVERSGGTAQCNAQALKSILDQINEKLQPLPYTLICSSKRSHILIYHVMVSGELTYEKVSNAAYDARVEDLDEDNTMIEEDLAIFMEDFTVLQVFKGEIEPVLDLR